MEEQVIFFCLKEDLSTYDPYDIWKTSLGVKVKNWFNSSKYLAGGPALLMTLYDQFLNNDARYGYHKQEYPIVRALAAQTLLHWHNETNNPDYLNFAKIHLDWLVDNSSKGYSGFCWGLGFKWAVIKGVIYDANTPHSTHTPYALEAFDLYTKITNDDRYIEVIKSCFNFYENDLIILSEEEDCMGISYGPIKDRVVNNAVSYTIFAYSIFLQYFPEKESYIKHKMHKFFNFLKKHQLEDGSWYYAPEEASSFIDCFHSCIILKNLFKAGNLLDEQIDDWNEVIEKGYEYVLSNFYNEKEGLFKRFSKTNKLSIVNFDLYDNAGVLELAKLLNDLDTIKKLEPKIKEVFTKNNREIYSSKNIFGKLINKNTLRWAVMPYLFAQSLSDAAIQLKKNRLFKN